MNFKDAIRRDIAEKRKDITDFVHTKPCSICGSTHGCGCSKELDREAEGNEFNSWGF